MIQRFEYDPESSSFRNWLFTLVRNRANKWVRKQARQPIGAGRTTIQGLVDEQSVSEIEREWDEEYRENALGWAARLVRSESKKATWAALWRAVVLSVPIPKVATNLGLSLATLHEVLLGVADVTTQDAIERHLTRCERRRGPGPYMIQTEDS